MKIRPVWFENLPVLPREFGHAVRGELVQQATLPGPALACFGRDVHMATLDCAQPDTARWRSFRALKAAFD